MKDAEKATPEELQGKYLLGEFIHRTDRPGIVDRYQQFLKKYEKE
jgi:hypothetical protein